MRSLKLQAESHSILQDFNDGLLTDALNKVLLLCGQPDLRLLWLKATLRTIDRSCAHIHQLFCEALLILDHLGEKSHWIQVIGILHKSRFFNSGGQLVLL